MNFKLLKRFSTTTKIKPSCGEQLRSPHFQQTKKDKKPMSNPQQPMTLADDGNPFASEKDANEFLKLKEFDPKIFKVFKQGGGFCIFNTAILPAGLVKTLTENKKTTAAKSPTTPKMKYFHVKFQQKSTENDDNCVSLSVNGDVIIMQRDTDVILPESYLEAADHATRKHFE